MSLTIEAVYENGILRPAAPLPFKDREKVMVTVRAAEGQGAPASDEAERIVRRSSGMLGWTGDVETLRRVAEDPEFSPLERP